MSVTIDISELEGLADLLLKAPDQAALVAHVAGVEVGGQVQSRAQAAAPTDRPWLSTQGIRRKSWKDTRGSHTDIFTVPDPEGRPEGIFVEYGTSITPPQPFLAIQASWAEAAFPAVILSKIEPLL